MPEKLWVPSVEILKVKGVRMDQGTLFLEYARPIVWPPVAATSLHRIVDNGHVVEFLCFPDGHFALIVSSYRGRLSEHHFQRVSIPEGGIVKIAFSWSREGVNVAAGGVQLSRLGETNQDVLDLKVKGHVEYITGLLSFAPKVLEKVSPEE
ncbi:MAG: hypothetical protein AAB150_19695 [Pseudomonadota bacterium]